MNILALSLSLITATVPAFQEPLPPPAAEAVLGTWQNPHRSIAVRTEMCGEQLCGRIVAATAEALQDARDSGVPNLIGTELLRAYRKDNDTRWTGTVYVPDMGKSFYSHIVVVSQTRLRISGCILGGWICKSQEWTRL
ncbi:DUF2147 domain-containing protein [Sphingomonas sp. RS6]